MQKIHLFLVFVLCITIFSACKKEEEKEPTADENLVGKTWIITNSSTEVSTSFGLLPPQLINQLNPTRGIEGQTMLFNANGTFQLGTATPRGNWSLSADGKKLTFSGFLEGNLVQAIDAQTLANLQTFEVTTLTSSKLAIQNNTTVPVPTQLSGLPLPITATVKLNITFDEQ